MSRPEHLHCPNTAEGIHRINQMQEQYDKDPEEYERRERYEEERRCQQEEENRQEFEMDQQRMAAEEEDQFMLGMGNCSTDGMNIDDLPF